VFTHERHEVGLGSLLESHDGRRLEAEVGLEVLGDLTDETLEGELADEELGGPGGRGVRSNSSHKKGFLGSGVAGVTHFWYRRISRRATVPGLYR
jgi:hypothetical protein